MEKDKNFGTAYPANYDQQIASSEKASVVVKTKGGYPFISCLTFYIPENLDLDQTLLDNPPLFTYCKDKFVYILNLIYSLPSRRKKSIEEYYGYTPISKAILGSTIKDYRKYIDYLKLQNIVEEDNYITNVKCAGLRFTETYRKTLNQKPFVITSWTLIKNITYLRKNYDNKLTKELIPLKSWFADLDVDVKGAKKYLKRKYKEDYRNPLTKYSELRYNSRLLPIQRLYTKEEPLFFVDKTAGRLHTYITQLKSELRKFLKWKGKILYSIDISNSQPYLLQSFLNKETYDRCNNSDRLGRNKQQSNTIMLGDLIESISEEKDVILFKSIVSSGQFYEEFGKLLQENGEFLDIPDHEMRSHVKDITFSTIFSKNNAIKYNNSIRIFKKIFPNVYKVIKEIKNEKHNELAIALQNLEAELVLHKACKKITQEKPHVPIFTLHDSIITTQENVIYVQTVLKKVMKDYIGNKPKLKIERWE
ncbi:hypothetical protein [Chryseobacterium sp.]|uniref:hypothetical protein n=1 Tax=Chryseobacterium sp. TaxID=1871047 RepID=UPI0012BEEC71|nr:hypothetical protein [Chryseobacterium sp.]MPS66268.1 hypothetical protein [Chryseobacterium sp.]